jgi:hypothetical protein
MPFFSTLAYSLGFSVLMSLYSGPSKTEYCTVLKGKQKKNKRRTRKGILRTKEGSIRATKEK